MQFTHIIGPAIAGSSAWEGGHHFKMGSVQPRACYSLYCSLSDDIPADHIYFQFVIRYTNRSHQWSAGTSFSRACFLSC